MHWIPVGLAVVLALAIIAIGVRYLAAPRAEAPSFGLPLPEAGPNIPGWLRLKGVRDIASGLAVLALLGFGGSRAAGILLLVDSLIPLGDMSVILTAKGSTRTALGVHGVTAVVMIATAIPLILGGR